MRSLIRFLFLAVSAMVFSCALPSFSQNITIGVEDIEYFPIYANRDNGYSGFARELFDEFGKRYNYTIEYKILPIKRLYQEFLSGRVDLKFPDNQYWAQDKKEGKTITYSEEVLKYIDGVMVSPNHANSDKDFLKKLGILRGFTPWDYLDDQKAGIVTVHESSTLKSLIKQTLAGRIDGVYFNVLVARYYMKHTFFEENALVFNSQLPHSESSYFLSTATKPEIITHFNEFMSQHRALVDQLKDKYELHF